MMIIMVKLVELIMTISTVVEAIVLMQRAQFC